MSSSPSHGCPPYCGLQKSTGNTGISVVLHYKSFLSLYIYSIICLSRIALGPDEKWKIWIGQSSDYREFYVQAKRLKGDAY